MQTDSSASLTYLASVSATEYTTTVRMPSSRQARWMRSAISPRLAIRIFSNTSADEEKRLTVFDRLAVFDQDRLDHARGGGAGIACARAANSARLTILTFSSPSVISSSAMPDSCTRSISFLSLRKSIG